MENKVRERYYQQYKPYIATVLVFMALFKLDPLLRVVVNSSLILLQSLFILKFSPIYGKLAIFGIFSSHMWWNCPYIFIPVKSNRRAQSFGFVRFTNLIDVDSVLLSLNQIWIGIS